MNREEGEAPAGAGPEGVPAPQLWLREGAGRLVLGVQSSMFLIIQWYSPRQGPTLGHTSAFPGNPCHCPAQGPGYSCLDANGL